MEILALLQALWRSRTGPLLVALQVALALAVLVNVGYVIVQRVETINRPTGLDLENMFWVTTQSGSTKPPDPAGFVATQNADLAWLNALPGVIGAATAVPLPQGFGNIGLPFATDPKELGRPGPGHGAAIYMGSERYIDAMGLKLIAGRGFSHQAVQPGTADWQMAVGGWAPEIIVTKAFADELFPHGGALGKTVYAGLINKPAVIVGIVELMRGQPAPAQFDKFTTHIVIAPILAPGGGGPYVVRAAPGRRAELMKKVEKELANLQPNRFISQIEAYDVTATRTRASTRASVIILTAVAILVLLVTIIGIVGLAAFNVASRTRQLGTRRAIGARRFHIVRYFLVENWLTTTAGVVLGCGLAVAAGVELSRMYQMQQLPLYYLAGGVLVLWSVGLMAVLVPALRAARVSPAVATRTV
jgi:putative ABC transport system permease protein